MKDYRDSVEYKNSTEAEKAMMSPAERDAWWQEKDKEGRAKSVVALGRKLVNEYLERQQTNLRNARLYENVDLSSFGGAEFANAVTRNSTLGSKLISLNVITACIDTLGAKICKNKPRPNFITSGGNWDQQIKARNLDKFMKGCFYELKLYEKAKLVGTDSYVFGTGFMYFYQASDGRLECERVLPDEIYVDDTDGKYGKPRMMMRRKTVQKAVLCAMYPKFKEAIYAAKPGSEDQLVTKNKVMDCAEVWESWYLPSKPGAKDGMHCICIDDCELFSERWELDCFPFVKLTYKDRLVGFWGKGIAESLLGIQTEINRLVRSISEQLQRKGRGRIFVQHGSKVNPAHITNGIADIVTYHGSPPIVDSASAVSQDEFAQLDRLYNKAFQEVGISELSAGSKKPAGLDAAVALREYSDIESERFALVHQKWETFFLDCAELIVNLISKQIGSSGYKVRLPSKRFVIEVDWADIDLDVQSYVMQMWPVSSLPQTPAARYSKVREMMQDGFVDKATAQRLLEFPDIEAETNLGNAAIDDVDATISAILDAKEPELLPLDPYQNYKLLMQRALAAYLYARHHGCSEERLNMLRLLINNAATKETAATAPPPQAPPEMMPPQPGMLAPMAPMEAPGMSAPPPPMMGPGQP